MVASRTPEQIEAQKKYENKVKEIKIRVPNSYYDKIQERMEEWNKANPDEKYTSLNKFVLSFLEKALDEPMVSIREQNKINKELNCTK